jgi:cytidine deaminase
MINLEKLLSKAKEASKNSYSPYSNYKVGAALIDNEGNIYKGNNIENASYGLSLCAERVAIANAQSSGCDMKKVTSIAIYADGEEYPLPCGACLQVMREFFDDNLEIIVACHLTEVKFYKLKDLMPIAFKL